VYVSIARIENDVVYDLLNPHMKKKGEKRRALSSNNSKAF
jgi:hypothetical protein